MNHYVAAANDRFVYCACGENFRSWVGSGGTDIKDHITAANAADSKIAKEQADEFVRQWGKV
jgi:hypothetical protein